MARKSNFLAAIAALRRDRARLNKKFRSGLIRTIVFRADGRKVRGWQRIMPPPGQYFSSDGVDNILTQAIAKCEEMYPGRTFEMIELSDGTFNFVERRDPSQPPAGETAATATHLTRATFQSAG